MQAAFQKHVHASISKTINLPNTASKEDCAEALLMAWKLKLKGITIYRAGSRHNVVLTLKDTSLDPDEKNVTAPCNPQQAFSE
jgi:ribonucleoside-diphosphate reductase alpha chain